MQAEAHSLRNELDAAKLQHLRLQEAAAAAEAATAAAAAQLEAQREGEGVLQVGFLCAVGSGQCPRPPTLCCHAPPCLACHLRLISPHPFAPQAEALSLRRALAEAQRKLAALSTDTGSMIDRRIVVKMLITYFEKDHAGGWGRGQAQQEGMAPVCGPAAHACACVVPH